MSAPERQYSDKEIQTILKRAAERQKAQAATSETGLTLEELKEIGAETGLDPRHIAAAAAEVERGGSQQTESLSTLESVYGMSATIREDRVLPGTLDDATWAEAVAVLRSTFKTKGRTESIGRRREWSAFTSSGLDFDMMTSDAPGQTLLEGLNLMQNVTKSPVYVEAKPDPEGTRLSVRYEMPTMRLLEAPAWIGTMLFISTTLALLFTVFGNFDLAPQFIPLFLLVFGLFGFVYQRYAHRKELRVTRERCRTALDRIEEVHAVASPAEAQASTSEPNPSHARVSLDDTPASESHASPSSRRTRT